MEIQTLLNSHILGGANQADEERAFYRVNLTPPDYDARFFETSPTMWAVAYEFEQRVSAGDRRATEDWASLILLHYCRILRAVNCDAKTLEEGKFDPDLWTALSRTFPKTPQTSDLKSLGVLMTPEGLVIGGIYSSVIFFGGRGVDWSASPTLKEYLDDESGTLSWERCRQILLGTKKGDGIVNGLQNRFSSHLKAIIPNLPAQNPNTRSPLAQFCQSEFGLSIDALTVGAQIPGQAAGLNSDPATWSRLNDDKNARDFLDGYPFVREKILTVNSQTFTERTYYFVAGMPAAPDGWMTKPLGLAMPSPSQFVLNENGSVTVNFNEGNDNTCFLTPHERVVQLKDCFLERPAYCGVPSDESVPAINALHKVNNNGQGLHRRVQESAGLKNNLIVWLAPITTTFINEFPELILNPADIIRTFELDERVGWKFSIPPHRIEEKPSKPSVPFEVMWETKPAASKTLSNLDVSIWPPKTDKEWCMYTVYGTAGIYQDDQQQPRKAERWVLVGEQGATLTNIELDNHPSATYISILEGNGQSNIPLGLLLLNKAGSEAGVAFLKPLESREGRPIEPADLSVDFGTTNTALAYKSKDEEPRPLNFSLAPLMLWGKQQDFDEAAAPGFVPFEWGATESVYPSVLLAKRAGWGERGFGAVKDNLKLEHLWRAGIPALYKDEAIINSLYKGEYEKSTWTRYDDMKWSNDPDELSARTIFLGRSLLYACAELFFREGKTAGRMVFTYPLAFSSPQLATFEAGSTSIANSIRSFCYTKPIIEDRILTVSESRAVASYKKQEANVETLELFIDTGGGTTDLALRYATDYLVLDSFKVAGAAYFAFAQKNLEKGDVLRGAGKFKEHLGRLLQNKERGEPLDSKITTSLKPFYSLLIARNSTAEFVKKERVILSQGMGEQIAGEADQSSYQRYRTQMFFKHIIAYALLQACAAAAEGERALKIKADRLRIDLTLGGNAWGFTMFGELERTQLGLEAMAKSILDSIKTAMIPHLPENEKNCLNKLKIGTVNLLNQKTLSEAKTAVAVGALRVDPRQKIESKLAAPYTGINMTGLKAKKGTSSSEVRWCEHWTTAVLLEKTGQGDSGSLVGLTFDTGDKLSGPVHPTTSIFIPTDAGGELPERYWLNINSLLNDPEKFRTAEKLIAPINYFISYLYSSEEQDAVLNTLAALADSFQKPATATLR